MNKEIGKKFFYRPDGTSKSWFFFSDEFEDVQALSRSYFESAKSKFRANNIERRYWKSIRIFDFGVCDCFGRPFRIELKLCSLEPDEILVHWKPISIYIDNHLLKTWSRIICGLLMQNFFIDLIADEQKVLMSLQKEIWDSLIRNMTPKRSIK